MPPCNSTRQLECKFSQPPLSNRLCPRHRKCFLRGKWLRMRPLRAILGALPKDAEWKLGDGEVQLGNEEGVALHRNTLASTASISSFIQGRLPSESFVALPAAFRLRILGSLLPFLNCCMECLGRAHWQQLMAVPEFDFLHPGSGQRHLDSKTERNDGCNLYNFLKLKATN